jgi:hypothetical protein
MYNLEGLERKKKKKPGQPNSFSLFPLLTS